MRFARTRGEAYPTCNFDASSESAGLGTKGLRLVRGAQTVVRYRLMSKRNPRSSRLRASLFSVPSTLARLIALASISMLSS